jgi:hypothetical protein
MKTIFLGDAARDSGSFGFSEAWPLGRLVSKKVRPTNKHMWRLPSSPHSVDVHTLGNIDDELDICVVVVVCASGYLLQR